MLPSVTLPVSLRRLVEAFAACFTAPTFVTFCQLVVGSVVATGRRTVTGMLVGAGLAGRVGHHRMHRFFSHAAWDPAQLGLVAAKLVVNLLTDAAEPIQVVVDDTLFKRTGRSVHGVGWFHDGSSKNSKKSGYGNNWVICAIIVRLPFLDRPVALPVLARLVVKDTTGASRLDHAVAMATALGQAFPGRRIHVTGDAAYAGRALRDLPSNVFWTTRLRSDAALYDLPPGRTGKPGRPPKKGKRLPALKTLAVTATFTTATVTRYGRTSTVQTATIRCLWYSVFGTREVTVTLIRAQSGRLEIALITTDPDATATTTIERYAARWSIEVAIEEAKQLFGTGHARNRTPRAVKRTVPFQLTCQTLTTIWYATAGHDPSDVDEHRARAPWYRTKTQPSVADMLGKLRHVLIAAEYRPPCPDQPTQAEIHTIRLAWDNPNALAV